MTIKWNLTQVMYNKGVFTPTELRKLIKEKVNYEISAPAVHRLVNGLPKEFKLATIDAICQALECSLGDVIVYESPTKANKCVQPLVLESSFKPPKKAKKIEKEKELDIDIPEI